MPSINRRMSWRGAGLAVCLLCAGRVTGAAAAAPDLWQRDHLLGNLGGLRTVLSRHGVSLDLSETSEVLGNPTGGVAQGAVYDGALQMTLGIDLGKAIGLAGGRMKATAYQIQGQGLSATHLDNLNTVSSIEAESGARLYELWYQQSFMHDRADLRLGELGADQEFIVSNLATVFISASFGWPILPAVDMPSGGPAYPLSTLGARLRVRPSASTTLLLGVFNGDPAGPGTGDPQQRDPSGLNFRLDGGTLVMGEAQYALNQDPHAGGLPGTYKFGFWYNSNAFPSQAYVSSGTPPSYRGDWSLYAVADQIIYRPAGVTEGGLGVFARVMGAPSDRNAVGWFIDGGVTYQGPFGRPNDTIGLGFGWTRISSTAIAADQALSAVTPGGYPVRSAETVVELTYQAQLAPWWQVQPDFQYIFRPGGGIPNPDQAGSTIADAAVFALRTVVTF